MIVLEKIDGIEAENKQINYCVDMFKEAKPIIDKYGYAVTVDENNQDVFVLKEQKHSTYRHSNAKVSNYDLWFLNQYDCIVLNECTEFAVDLCQNVLDKWEGKRLVLIGLGWEGLFDSLNDLSPIECFYEPVWTDDGIGSLIQGFKQLIVTIGTPALESNERYELGIIFYDELMPLIYMFSDRRCLGNKHPDKEFFILNASYKKSGLFAIMYSVAKCARYIKAHGMIPIICLNDDKDGMYQDYDGDDYWKKFFIQPEEYTLEEVLESKNVTFSPVFANGSVMNHIMSKYNEEIQLDWPKYYYNEHMWEYINQREEQFLPYPEKTLGVLARGTDYVKNKLHNHSIHASIEMLCDKIDEFLSSGEYEYIYLATEDQTYCDYAKKRYGEKIFFTDQRRYDTKENEMLADIHINEKNKDGFLLGAEYALSIYLLAKCKSLLASGNCGGVVRAVEENEKKYKDIVMFDLGRNA